MTSSGPDRTSVPPPAFRVPIPPRGVIRTRAQRETWTLIWPRVSAAPGFDVGRDVLAVAALIVYYLDYRREAVRSGDADLVARLQTNVRAIAQTLGLPGDDAAIEALFAPA